MPLNSTVLEMQNIKYSHFGPSNFSYKEASMAISSRYEVRHLLLVVAGLQNPLLDGSSKGPFTQYNLLTAEIQSFEECDKVHGDDSFFTSCQS
jgi:hypothetical protein